MYEELLNSTNCQNHDKMSHETATARRKDQQACGEHSWCKYKPVQTSLAIRENSTEFFATLETGLIKVCTPITGYRTKEIRVLKKYTLG